MKKTLIAWLFALAPLAALGAGGTGWPLDRVHLDLADSASLQRGAQLYMNYCMGCHSLEHARYERTANDLGIPLDLFEKYLKFDASAKIGDLMQNAMATKDGKQWFGAAPPDLTLIARARGPEWLYTYLRTFYADPSRPYGVNNKVFPDVGMPHMLLELQGMQECAPGPAHAANGGVLRDPLSGEEKLYGDDGKPLNPCGRLKVAQPGSMEPAEYDKAMRDLVNFLTYIGEPIQLQRQRIGIYALLFLAVFFVFAWLLNREYWKDVH